MLNSQMLNSHRMKIEHWELSIGQIPFRIALFYLLSGSAKTYNAFPVAGGCSSGAIVAGTARGLPPPFPVATATYCLPSILNVTGKPCTEVDRRVSQSTAPVFTSNALNL